MTRGAGVGGQEGGSSSDKRGMRRLLSVRRCCGCVGGRARAERSRGIPAQGRETDTAAGHGPQARPCRPLFFSLSRRSSLTGDSSLISEHSGLAFDHSFQAPASFTFRQLGAKPPRVQRRAAQRWFARGRK